VILRAGCLASTALVLLAATLSVAASTGEVESRGEILVSRPLAEELELSAGDLLEVTGRQPGADPGQYRIVGVYEPVPDPIKLTRKRFEIRMHLQDLLDRTGAAPGGRSVPFINIGLTDTDQAAQVADRLNQDPLLLARPARGAGGDVAVFTVLERFHTAIAAIALLGSCAFLLALMVIRAEERRETAGILRILGVRRRRILGEVLLEGVLIAIPGGLFGIVLALATQGLINRFFQWRYDTVLVFVEITPLLAARCLALSVPLGVAAGLVASWSILRNDPLDMVRS
jgi:ABC-type antimicrobial peptide transport system permease subunit